MVAVGQTITIVNNSGKIVSTSKHLVNVFTEAKTAYNERKAELQSQRRRALDVQDQERKARTRLAALTLAGENDDARSARSSRHSSDSRRSSRTKPASERSHQRPPITRGVSDSFYANDRPVPSRHRSHSHRPSPLRSQPLEALDQHEPRVGELARRHTDGLQISKSRPRAHPRRASLDDIDMDLAYGELPPPLPERSYDNEIELRSKMSGLQRLLDECNCLQHSVTAMIDNLQKNPDALAAVALTLGEISSIAGKMAPGTLSAMKGSFPTIIALLASSEFAIAAGVGIGVTIIALGGYKIIKKIRAKKDDLLLENGVQAPYEARESPEEDEMDQLREISRIEKWRRGIADAEASALGTSVDGEFITPHATRTLVEEGRLTEADLKPPASTTSKKHRSRKSKSEVSSKSKSKTKSSSKSHHKKEPSTLRMLFAGRS